MVTDGLRVLLVMLAVPLLLIGEAHGATVTLAGEADYRERIALPPGAEITVSLIDIARQDVAAPVLAESRYQVASGPPYPYRLTVDEAVRDRAGARLALVAHLDTADGVWFRTTTIRALPGDLSQPVRLTMTLVRTGEATQSPRRLPPIPPVVACDGGEPFWSLELDGPRARLKHLGPDGLIAEPPMEGRQLALDDADPPTVVWRGHSKDGQGDMVAVIEGSTCQLGEAAPTMPMRLLLSLPDGSVRVGCCAHAL